MSRKLFRAGDVHKWLGYLLRDVNADSRRLYGERFSGIAYDHNTECGRGSTVPDGIRSVVRCSVGTEGLSSGIAGKRGYADAVEYAKVVIATFHEKDHVRQILDDSDDTMRLCLCLSLSNPGMYVNRYSSNIAEIAADCAGLRGARDWLSRNHGKAVADDLLYQCVHSDDMLTGFRKVGSFPYNFSSVDAAIQSLSDAEKYFCGKSFFNPPGLKGCDWFLGGGDAVGKAKDEPWFRDAMGLVKCTDDLEQSLRMLGAVARAADPDFINMFPEVPDKSICMESEFPLDFLERWNLCEPNEYENLRRKSLAPGPDGRITKDCRLAVVGDRGPYPDGFHMLSVIQACDLVGHNCPACAEPAISDGPVQYSAGRYRLVMDVANHEGDCPVFYADVCDGIVDVYTLKSSQVPFSMEGHRKNVQAVREKAELSSFVPDDKSSLLRDMVAAIPKPDGYIGMPVLDGDGKIIPPPDTGSGNGSSSNQFSGPSFG